MIKTIEQKVFKFISQNSLIDKGDRILIALSGGADSVFLLYFLYKFKKRFRIQIGAFHLNHKLRAKDADEDEMFCKTFCRELDVDCFTVSKNVKAFSVKKKISLEEAGRKLRYDELRKIASENNFNKIATAHNSNDNAETVLLNLVKGTGLQGISGIPFQRGNIIRPVLILTKEEILNYLDIKGISYRVDVSNLSNDYERNFLRNEILPKLKKRLNPKLENSLFISSQNLRAVNAFIRGVINEHLDGSVSLVKRTIRINLSRLKNLNEDLFSSYFKRLIENYLKIESTSEIVNSLFSLMSKQPGRSTNLGNNFKAVRERNEIIIYNEKKQDKIISDIKLKVGGSIRLNDKVFSITAEKKDSFAENKNRNIEYISADNLKSEFVIRKWVEGDRFIPLGMKGTKKISDFLNEQKIPSSKKKSQLLLTNSGKIVWVIGLRIDDRVKITGDTKKIYQLCLK